MTFLHPTLLAVGLALVAAPIIIHLFVRRRRKPVEWGAMRFLLEAYQQHKRRLAIEQLILLALRCLVIAAIAIGVAAPLFAGGGAGRGARTLHLIIDTSLTSSAGLSTPALDRLKSEARTLLATLDGARGDRVSLIAGGAPADAIVIPPSSDIGAVGRLVDGLEPTSGVFDLAGACERIASLSAVDRANSAVVVLSEFRAGSTDLGTSLPALTPAGEAAPEMLASRPAIEGIDNVAIIGVESDRSLVVSSSDGSSSPPAVRVTVVRTGPAASVAGSSTVRARLRTSDGDGDFASTSVRWSAGESSQVVTLTPPTPTGERPTWAAIEAEIDRDAIAGDNRFVRPIEARRVVRVGLGAAPVLGPPLSIDSYSPADWLRVALSPATDGALRLVEIDPRTLGQPAALAGLDALVLPRPDLTPDSAWSAISAFVRAGGLLVVSPPPDDDSNAWFGPFDSALATGWRVAREIRDLEAPVAIGTDSPLRHALVRVISAEIADLARPVSISRTLDIVPGSDDDIVLTLSTGAPMVVATTPADSTRGLVVLLGVAPDLRWTDLPTKPLMVPLVHEIVRQGVGLARPALAALAGSAAPAPAGAVELRSLNENGEALNPGAPARLSGFWRAVDARGQTIGSSAINADTRASDTEIGSNTEVDTWLRTTGAGSLSFLADVTGTESGASSNNAPDTRPIGPMLLALAAILAVIELVAARLFSRATVHSGGVAA